MTYNDITALRFPDGGSQKMSLPRRACSAPCYGQSTCIERMDHPDKPGDDLPKSSTQALKKSQNKALRSATALRGVTLLEVLVAVAILALAILPLMGVFDMAAVSGDKSLNQSVATSLAASIKQECEHVPFEEYGRLALDNPGVSPLEVPPAIFWPESLADLERYNASGKYPEFTCRAMVYPYDDGNDHLHRLEVAVGWQDKKGVPKEINLATLLISQKVY